MQFCDAAAVGGWACFRNSVASSGRWRKIPWARSGSADGFYLQALRKPIACTVTKVQSHLCGIDKESVNIYRVYLHRYVGRQGRSLNFDRMRLWGLWVVEDGEQLRMSRADGIVHRRWDVG